MNHFVRLHFVQQIRAICIAATVLGWGCQNRIDPANVPKFVIRVEQPVTNILSPLTPEGNVDYLEAVNRRHARGVTADNNWDVVVREVFGPLEALDEPSQRKYYQ